MIDKVVGSFDEAVSDMRDGATLLIGGFGGFAECPSYLIAAVARKGVKNLTIVANSAGWGLEFRDQLVARMRPLLRYPEDYYDQGILIERGQVSKAIVSFAAAIGHVQTPLEKKAAAGEVEVELVPQGTMAERIRAAKAGIPAFYSPVGAGTFTAQGKEVRQFDGRECVLERAIRADYALIRAHRADRYGNLVYRGSTRTFNATMAGAARITIAEVDEIVELGELEAEHIVTPGVYVQRVVVRPSSPRPWNVPS